MIQTSSNTKLTINYKYAEIPGLNQPQSLGRQKFNWSRRFDSKVSVCPKSFTASDYSASSFQNVWPRCRWRCSWGVAVLWTPPELTPSPLGGGSLPIPTAETQTVHTDAERLLRRSEHYFKSSPVSSDSLYVWRLLSRTLFVKLCHQTEAEWRWTLAV